jgi:type 1 glutamine amidotransferase
MIQYATLLRMQTLAGSSSTSSSALIVWGGWEGHEPERVAGMLAEHLREGGFAVTSVAGVDDMLTLDLARFDVIVPVWSFGIQHPAALAAVLAAVEQGVGLAAFHGGIDWFADRDYARMVGGHFVFHPPSHRYEVVIEDRTHPIMQGMVGFTVETEQYYFHLDPGNHVLTSTPFGDLRMPNTWVRTYGLGRVFYCSLAHTIDVLEQPPVLAVLLNGIRWATRE